MFGLFKKKNEAVPVSPQSNVVPSTLEAQLDALAALGLRLSEDASIDDFLFAFPRKQYEGKLFDLVLNMLGSEIQRQPWGRPICPMVWDFDTECIYETGDYAHVVKRLCQVAQRPDCLKEVMDFVDIDAGQAWLKFEADGMQARLELEVNNDWADVEALVEVMAFIEDEEHRFYAKDNGQAMVLFYLDATTAAELNRLSGNALSPAVPESSEE